MSPAGKLIAWTLGGLIGWVIVVMIWSLAKAHPDATPWIALGLVLAAIFTALAWPRAGER